MAFPATYDFNYYKGDTFEFRIYPKKNDGTVFELSAYYDTNILYNTNAIDGVDNPEPPAPMTYEQSRFTISTLRGIAGAATSIPCFARISDDGTFVQCAIRPSDSVGMVAGTEYVYDVEVRLPQGRLDNPFYEKVHTLLTGKITVTDQITADPVPGD